MENKRIHFILAGFCFAVALITYGITMQPTVPFWDCGEFAAAAASLGIPHPPGTPLWTLWGHVAMMFPIFGDIVARYNFLAVLCASVSVMMLYLTLVRVIRIWRGVPKSTADSAMLYGASVIGALAFCWSDSVWFNSTECIVFAPGLLFITLILWLIFVWYDHANEPHNEKYLLLIMYLIGLSLGVHQMSMLAFFPVWMMIYYRKWPNTTLSGWIVMVISSLVAFAYIFLIVLSKLVDWAGDGKGFLSVAVLAAVIGGVIYTANTKKKLANLFCWSALLIFLGYSTYTMLMVRAAQDPPMDQHRPTTFAVMSEYINREQYGGVHELPRRLEDPDHSHEPTFNNYTSDGDFFWRYQTNHMWTRYLGWNFIGRLNDEQDAGVDYSKTWALPFALGLFGIFWHFRRDPKRALTFLGAFLIMGIFTAWYQNQQDPQPRERDYFYVGAFYIYAMWIGIGSLGILEWMRSKWGAKSADEKLPAKEGEDKIPILTGETNMRPILIGLTLVLIVGPLNQLFGLAGLASGEPLHKSSKYGEYSRYHNYVPFEYAYNFLQSCDSNAILFTAGDNDTFPLWAMQDAYGIRRDVRIINLSLGNMGWYIRQLKHATNWGIGQPVNLPGFTDQMLDNPDETAGGLHADHANAEMINVAVNAATMSKFTGKSEPGTMTWKYTGQFPAEGGYFFTIADQLIREVVKGNINSRPIYFASLVPPSYMAGLEGHLIFEGLSARITPVDLGTNTRSLDVPMNEPAYRASIMNAVKTPSATPKQGMFLNSYADPASNRSALDDRYSQTYYYAFFRLASYYIHQNKMTDAVAVLDTIERRIPPEHMEPEYRFSDLFSELYLQAGDSTKALKYVPMATADMSINPSEDQQQNITTLFHSGDFYLKLGLYDSARKIFTGLGAQLNANDKQIIDFKLLEIDARVLDKKGDKQGAYAKYNELVQKYAPLASSGVAGEYPQLAQRRDQLKQELGIKDSLTQGFTIKPGQQSGAQIQIAPPQPGKNPAQQGQNAPPQISAPK